MTSSSSDARRYSCSEPWAGILSVETNQDVTFCPCFLKMKIGNLRESSLQEVWNAPALQEIRECFREGVLPEPCKGQLCPPVVGESLGG